MSTSPATTETIQSTVIETSSAYSSLAHNRKFREQIGHVSRHSSIFFLGAIFSAITGYFFKIYLARVLGAEALGIYALGITLVGLFGIFNVLGLPQAAVRFIAAYIASGRVQHLGRFLISASVLLLLLNLALAGVMLLAGPAIARRFYHAPALTPYIGIFAAI